MSSFALCKSNSHLWVAVIPTFIAPKGLFTLLPRIEERQRQWGRQRRRWWRCRFGAVLREKESYLWIGAYCESYSWISTSAFSMHLQLNGFQWRCRNLWRCNSLLWGCSLRYWVERPSHSHRLTHLSTQFVNNSVHFYCSYLVRSAKRQISEDIQPWCAVKCCIKK